MAAANALAVVRAIQQAAEGQDSEKMKVFIPQVSNALLCFLDHPDSRVRQGAGRTLKKFWLKHPGEFANVDLSKAQDRLVRCKADAADGTEDEEDRELRESLQLVLGEVKEQPPALVLPTGGAPEGRGEVVLRISDVSDSKVRGLILERTVKLSGVVSVTFEQDLIIVSTRTPALAQEVNFLADLLACIQDQGLKGVSLVRTPGAMAASMMQSGAVLVADEDADDPADSAAGSDDLDPVDAEDSRGYLDDDSDNEKDGRGDWTTDVDAKRGADGASGLGAGGTGSAFGSGGLTGVLGQQANPGVYSFFSHNQFNNGRSMQEFGDDPSIGARLAAAKRKEAERQAANESRLSRLSGWFSRR